MALKVANNQSLTAITALPTAVSGGAMNLISTQTASSSSTISFTSGIDSSYDEYVFKFINIHGASDDQVFSFNVSIDGGSNYNVEKTTCNFRAYHREDGGTTSLDNQASNNLEQGTGFQHLFSYINTDADMSCAGTLHLFNPSSTNFVKNFLFRGISPYPSSDSDGMKDQLVAGYANTTSAVNAIQFKMLSGNTDAGTIKMYGVS
tara:strand:+ start:316 stop:930 length:615 start_codon:yes stop_codon:yes gene_type:complete